jgi:predicted nucleic acid-binding protein
MPPLPGTAVLLVDTSVWIEVFRKPSRLKLESVADLDEIVTCLPVIQEVLQGFLEERAFRVARDAMFAFPIIESPLKSDVFEEAAQLYRTARRAGLTIRSGVDCLIATCAIRHGLPVLHDDRDFSFLAQVSPLEERRISLEH